MKLGKAKYSGEKKEIFKIKDGDNVYRILPPMGKLADVGIWSRYFRVCWGYKDSNGRLRPFVSPRVQNFNTKMIDVDCAAFNRSEKLKKEKDALVKQAKEFAKNGQPLPVELKKQIEDIKEKVQRFNIDSKHHMNVLTQDGKIGLLKLAGRGMQALRAEFKKMEAAGVDGTGVEGGRFMVITREGSGLDTVYSVRELKEQVQTEEYGLVERPMPHDLTESIINRLAAEAYELDDIYPTPTSEEVAEIVSAYEKSEVEGALVVDRILGSLESSNSKAEDKVNKRAEAVKEAPNTSITETKAETTTVNTGEIQTEVNTTTGEVVSETVNVDSAVETTQATNPAAQSDAEFLAELGVNLG